MPSNKNLSIAHKWFEAFNNHNLEQLLSLYDEEAEHYSPKLKIKKPETNGLIKGKLAMNNWWKNAFQEIPSLQYQVTSLTANENRVFMEYIRSAENEIDILVAEVLEINDKRIPVVLGLGGNNTQEILNTIEEFDFDGIDAVLSVSPYYNRPSQRGIFQHYKMIGNACPVPVILYNVPTRTGSNMDNGW